MIALALRVLAVSVIVCLIATGESFAQAGVSNSTDECVFEVSTQKTFDELMRDSAEHMMKDMAEAEMTGGAEHDFLSMMIPHHEGAINMAKALLLYGKDTELRNLARRIIADQQGEMSLMKDLLSGYKNGHGAQGDMKAMHAAMDEMHKGMTGLTPSGRPDVDFAMMMIPHHEGAIAMAQGLLPSVQNKTLRTLAEQIITEQKYEVQLMKEWLRRKGGVKK